MNVEKSLSNPRTRPVMPRRFPTMTLALVGCVSFLTMAVAQDPPPNTPPEGGGPQIIVAGARELQGGQAIEIQAIEISGDNAAIDFTPAFSFSTPAGGAVFNMSSSGGSGMMNLLQNDSVRNEVELSDEQYQKMQDFYQQRRTDIMKQVQQLTQLSRGGDDKVNNETVKLRGKKIKELIDGQQKEAEEKLKDLLLPHQLKRLEQVALRVQMKNVGTLNALVDGKLKEALELSDEDVTSLKDRWQEIDAQLQKDIAKLRDKAKQDLLKELSPTQKRKLDEVLGEEFDYQPTDWRKLLRDRGSKKAPAKDSKPLN